MCCGVVQTGIEQSQASGHLVRRVCADFWADDLLEVGCIDRVPGDRYHILLGCTGVYDGE